MVVCGGLILVVRRSALVNFAWCVIITVVTVLFGPSEDLAAVSAPFHNISLLFLSAIFLEKWRSEILNSNF